MVRYFRFVALSFLINSAYVVAIEWPYSFILIGTAYFLGLSYMRMRMRMPR